MSKKILITENERYQIEKENWEIVDVHKEVYTLLTKGKKQILRQERTLRALLRYCESVQINFNFIRPIDEYLQSKEIKQ